MCGLEASGSTTSTSTAPPTQCSNNNSIAMSNSRASSARDMPLSPPSAASMASSNTMSDRVETSDQRQTPQESSEKPKKKDPYAELEQIIEQFQRTSFPNVQYFSVYNDPP
ncbi:hypothetical protein ZHAS_00010427 [Anopheles sinensis]|uniref:Uncharacterized protein n=1 Tax=Anopheles sinensis TaxID=74873 RepID=A0A084VXJ6_ANOSI|nr:hypothetical protein ZHAS_00010427 [Anopheles sinensis]